jgi:hypothetical protein
MAFWQNESMNTNNRIGVNKTKEQHEFRLAVKKNIWPLIENK